MPVLRTPVLVVGAGVAGCVLALELAHHGVPSIVAERASRPPRHKELTLVSGRSMELLRRLGLATQIRRHGIAPDCPADVVWVPALGQPPVLVSAVPSVAEMLDAGATAAGGNAPIEPYLLLPGSELTGRLRDTARAHPLVDLREGWTFTDLRAEPGAAVAVLLEAGTGTRHIVEATHLAGCDGAQSTVRRCVGVTMERLTPPVHHHTVYFRSDDLVRPPAYPRTIITAGVTLSWRPDEKLWIARLPLPSGVTTADPAELLEQRLGLGPGSAEIVGVAQSEETLGVATAYRCGPVFLVGEAAHHLPPGETVDTCVGDAVDLGWKLAAAVEGWGGPALLDSYEDERRRRALIDRELAARALETRSRFGRLAAAGASQEVLAGVLEQEPPQIDYTGTGPADGAGHSGVVWQAAGAGTRTAPGQRPPAVRMADGAQLFDRLGPQFTLVDLTDDAHGSPLVASAAARGVPMKHLAVADAAVRARWEPGLVLVRPDQHVAWRSGAAPAPWDAVLDVVTGRRAQDHVNT